MTEKIDITVRYHENEEVRTNASPYIAYYNALSKTFDLNKFNTFCDVGCATNLLLDCIIKNYPHINGIGLEYFDYHIKYAPDAVKDKFLICDVRDPINIGNYDIVNCSELAEHIDKAYCNVMIENLKKMTKKYLVMTWSQHGGEHERNCDPNHQHLNPLKYNDYCNLLISHGFKKDNVLTEEFLKNARDKEFSSWWRESLVVWVVNQ